MKDILKNLNSFIYVCVVSLLLTACGGSSSDKNKYTISSTTNTINFSNEILVATDASSSVNVTFEGDGLLLGFAPEATPAAWLSYRTENVTASSATIHVNVENEELIAPGLYTTTLRLSTGNIERTDLVHHDIKVELRVWQLSTDTQTVVFNGTFGDTAIAAKAFELTSVDNEWTVSSDVEWLTLEPSSGTGSSTITVTPTIDGFTSAGLQQANIILTEATTGDTKSLPAELGLDNVYLYADANNIAFTETANVKAIEKTISILSNSASTLDWQATTEASWLTLTKNAETNQLTVSANSSDLANDSITNAEIILSTVEESTVINSSIAVNLYKNSELTENKSIEELNVNNNGIKSAPALPYVYIATANELRTYHQYTAELLNTITVSPEETLLEQLLVHPNGELILAKADETIVGEDEDGNPTEEMVTHRYKINLTDNSINEIEDSTLQFEPDSFVRFNNRYYVVSQTLEFADEDLQRLYWDEADAFFARAIDTAKQNEAFYALDANSSTFKRYQVTSNDFTSEKVSIELTHEYRPELLAEEEFITDFVTTDNDSGLYTISPTSEWIGFDGTTYTDNGLLETNEDIVTLALTKNNNGRAHYAKFDPTQGFVIDIFDNQQQVAAQIITQGSQPTGIEVSADNSRLVINAGSNDIVEFVGLSQFNTSAEQLTFNTTFNDSDAEAQTLALTGIGVGWTATTSAPWLIISQNTSEDGDSVSVDIDTSQISTWGKFTGTVTIYDPTTGSYKVITVNLAVDAVRLYSNFAALAFNDTPTKQTLVHTVDILTNNESSISWQASSNESWLSLAVDNDNNTLTITAIPANASADDIHYGTITLSSTEDGAALSSTINVSLNRQSTDAGDVTINDINANSEAISLDLVRPYIYIGVSDAISVYDINTGALVNTISSPLSGFDLTNFVMHTDGQSMLVSNEETYTDENEQQQTRVNHYRVNLADQTIEQINADNIGIDFRPVLIKTVDGMPVIVTQTQELADINLVRQSWDQANAVFAQNVSFAANKNNFVFASTGASQLVEFTLSYNAYADEMVTGSQTSTFDNDNFATLVNFALSSTGADIYTANSNLEWSSYDGSTYTTQGLLHAGSNISTLNTVVDSGNNSYFYRFDPTLGFTLTKYDSSQVEVWSQTITSGASQNFMAPDYQRVINLNTNTNTLTISSML